MTSYIFFYIFIKKKNILKLLDGVITYMITWLHKIKHDFNG